VKAILYTGLAASAVLLASPALADNQGQDQTPLPPAAAPSTTTVMATPTPTPGPVVNTGGVISGSPPLHPLWVARGETTTDRERQLCSFSGPRGDFLQRVIGSRS